MSSTKHSRCSKRTWRKKWKSSSAKSKKTVKNSTFKLPRSSPKTSKTSTIRKPSSKSNNSKLTARTCVLKRRRCRLALKFSRWALKTTKSWPKSRKRTTRCSTFGKSNKSGTTTGPNGKSSTSTSSTCARWKTPARRSSSRSRAWLRRKRNGTLLRLSMTAFTHSWTLFLYWAGSATNRWETVTGKNFSLRSKRSSTGMMKILISKKSQVSTFYSIRIR